MPTFSPNYSLALYDDTTDVNELFLNYRLAVNGPTNSNMTKIDTALGSVNTRLTNVEVGKRSYSNILINGGFDFASRQIPETYTTIPNGGYGADKWKIESENADVQYARSTSYSSGGNSKYAGMLKKITNSGKFIFYQTIDSRDTNALLGLPITFQVDLITSGVGLGATSLGMGIIKYTGTADTVPQTIVTDWSFDYPLLATGLSFAYGEIKAVPHVLTNTPFSATFTVPICNNLIFAIWTIGQFAPNDYILAAKAGVYNSNIVLTSWNPRPIQLETLLNKREYNDGWILDDNAWTYASATTFTVSGDCRNQFPIGTKIKLTQTTTRYFYVIGTSYLAPTTTVTITGGSDYTLDNAVITSPFYSYYTVPNGFPDVFNWTPTYAGFSADPVGAKCKFTLKGKWCTVNVSMPNDGTSNANTFSMTAPIASHVAQTGLYFYGTGIGRDNGISLSTPIAGGISSGASTLYFWKDCTLTNIWTTTNGKRIVSFQISYPISS